MKIDQILAAAVRGNASDVVLKTGVPPRFRYQSNLVGSDNGVVITSEQMSEWLQKILPADQQDSRHERDFAYQTSDGCRFRVNVFKQRGLFTIVARVILNHVRTLEELHLPQVLTALAQEQRGLILVTGVTGSGKTTTLAAMIDRINRQRAAHIVTIEDPIEYQFRDEMSVIEQREVGVDTASFSLALRAAMRQNPDVIMVGELRDRETIETALQAAETGHLVLSTLHTADAVSSLTRVTGMFAGDEVHKIRMSLGESLKAVISQRLVPAANGIGMVAAVEVMVGSLAIRDQIIKSADFSELRPLIRSGGEAYGMQTFDDSLAALVTSGSVRKEEALKFASSKSELELKLSGIG
jgi:twitching motility protein PilT